LIVLLAATVAKVVGHQLPSSTFNLLVVLNLAHHMLTLADKALANSALAVLSLESVQSTVLLTPPALLPVAPLLCTSKLKVVS
jgi:hypothetical protein